MRPGDLAQETWRALTANKGRSVLTMLGIVIGIGAVITMNSLIGGVSQLSMGMFGANAARIISIRLTGIDNFTRDDVDAIDENVQGYEYVMGKMDGNGTIKQEKRTYDAKVIGSGSRFCEAHGYQFSSGSSFTEEDERLARQVVVLSKRGAKLLFGSENANVLGKSINLNNTEYRIAGVTNKLDDFGSEQFMDDTVYVLMPLTTASMRVVGHQNITSVEGLASDAEMVQSIKTRTEDYLSERYKLQAVGNDDTRNAEEESPRTVSVTTNKTLLDQVNTSMQSFRMIALTVSAISLVVGGIGIMNMMLTNVTERIREIGLRKALGAKRWDIVSQFMLESICLCVVGGIVGVILGLLGAYALMAIIGQSLAQQISFDGEGAVMPVIDVGSIIIAVLVCVITGVVFGWYPAQRAARLDPVESLNHQ